MNYLQKKLSLILALSLCVGTLSGCGSSGTADTTTPDTTTSTTTPDSDSTTDPVDPESTTHVVVDHAGNEVEVPNDISRIVITSITPLPSVYSIFDGSAENLIGMSPSSMASTENSMLAVTIPGITEVKTDFMTDSEINIEELLAMEPDVVFYRAEETAEYEKLTAAGIPAVGFSTTQWASNSIETFEGWTTLLGEVLLQQDKAEFVGDYGREVTAMIEERLSAAGESLETPSIFFMFRNSAGVLQTSGSKHFGEYWATSAGGVNAANELEAANVEVGMEQVYEWDPDMIFISNFAPVLAEDVLNNAIEGQDWSTLTAVQEGNVYKCPLGMYRWYPPSSDTPLMLLWMAKTVHPELFEDIDMDEEIKTYYQDFYQVTLTDDQLFDIYNPTREAAG